MHENFYQLNVSTQPNPQHLLLIPDLLSLDPSLPRYLISDQLLGSIISNCMIPDQFTFQIQELYWYIPKRAYFINALKSILSATHSIMLINIFAQRGSYPPLLMILDHLSLDRSLPAAGWSQIRPSLSHVLRGTVHYGKYLTLELLSFHIFMV